jgi:hexosaminidase
MSNIIPKPMCEKSKSGIFTISANTLIYVEPQSDELSAIGLYLADKLRPATGYPFPVITVSAFPGKGNILLTTTGGDPALGEEGYELTVTQDAVKLSAYRPAGLFRGIQTIRQLLPAPVESPTLQSLPWVLKTGTIRDYPRFAWRGAMLDVARHFFKVEDVKSYIDLLAYYKLNVFHLHLTDDQGWRIMIHSWPRLATYGGITQVGGGEGGYYTQKQYADLVAYALSRYITLVPEIDSPGHTNAALASYTELNCDEITPALYTGIEVGFSSLCIDKEVTYRFLDDVIRELAAITPGPYIHIGGDESKATAPDDYIKFIQKAQAIILAHGKQPIGWEEIGQAPLALHSIAQHWNISPIERQFAARAAEQGAKIIISPGNRTYLDIKYNPSTPLGLFWPGYVEVQDAYNWDPAAEVEGVSESDLLGIEAPIWSETLTTLQDIEYMAFPRLPGLAEIGWSPVARRSWDEYRLRLAAQGPRWQAMQVAYYPSVQVPWTHLP